ncbi:MAG: aminotransferase class V-fold PLP-dependent enzyme [Candidatus Brocadiaceae bacterium]|nr:aminotransferase class V-fold PLP-dependent enzyme [Candidatus Brocadiaceae bacterium]
MAEGELIARCGLGDASPAAVCSAAGLRALVAGVDAVVPLYDGSSVPYVNLDNAATTPAFAPVVDCVEQYQQYYSSIHRGTGFKSLLSTRVYDVCRHIVADFIGARASEQCLVFTQNATHSLNKLASRLRLQPDDVVVTTHMEHHSNLLPWRCSGCRIEVARINRSDGTLDMADLEARVRKHAGRVRLVTCSGASNVTGNLPPFRQAARIAHAHGALFALDATQLVPHRAFELGDPYDPECVDFVVFSGHKMHAPFGCGVLAGRCDVFGDTHPDVVGGGAVHAVTDENVFWLGLPEREEAGTPNLLGVLALARAVQVFRQVGMDEVAEHERTLTRRLLAGLLSVDGLRVFGRTDPDLAVDRLGVFALEAEGYSHGLLAAVLGYEWGIGVRNGCFCAQPYVRELLNVSPGEEQAAVLRLVQGDHSSVPGLVRASLGVYNTEEEIDRFVEALRAILRDGPRTEYVLHPQHHDYVPSGCDINYDAYLPLSGS